MNYKSKKLSQIDTQLFFNRDTEAVAIDCLGKLLCHRVNHRFLAMRIIEVEAYYRHEKGSHASLGFTEKRKALFMPAGTIYMYYAHGKDSFNISCLGDGNALLIKSAFPVILEDGNELLIMQSLNPKKNGELREFPKLGSGQTLLCNSLNLKVNEWNGKCFKEGLLELRADNYHPTKIIKSRRLGIPLGRDEDLLLRFTDFNYASYATSNPLKSKHSVQIINFVPNV